MFRRSRGAAYMAIVTRVSNSRLNTQSDHTCSHPVYKVYNLWSTKSVVYQIYMSLVYQVYKSLVYHVYNSFRPKFLKLFLLVACLV